MMVKFSRILNTSILNNEKWIGFQGDSEYEHPTLGLMMGYWSFLGVSEDAPSENDWELDDEIEDTVLYKDYLFKVINAKGTVCIVQFHYNHLQRFREVK